MIHYQKLNTIEPKSGFKKIITVLFPQGAEGPSKQYRDYFIFHKNFFNIVRYMIFQCGLEPVLFQQKSPIL